MEIQINLTKELFIETIQTIKKQMEFDSKCCEAFKIILPNDYVSGYDNSLIVSQLIKFLKIGLNDNHKDSWIDYYIWDLEYGIKYQDACGNNQDGSPIFLRNDDELWKFLISNK